MLIPSDRQGEETEILSRIRRGQRIEQLETIRQRKDGTLFEVQLTISPVRDIHGKIVGASKIARDITQRRHSEKKLSDALKREIEARRSAEAANRAKDEFLASLSHELRTPLNPVLLIASDASENPNYPEAVRENFETIRKNIELEARLIDDLLDLTRITHGKLSLHTRALNVEDVLKGTISTVLSDVNEKRLKVVQKWNAPLSAVLGDEVRLQQVFWNVLRNAVKFTPNGGEITIETRTENGKFIASISDTGIGIVPEEMGGIFEAFSQGEHARDKTHFFGGLGLGLAITRRLVELHSGRIYASSTGRGQGSTFTIELPLSADGCPESTTPESTAQSARINHVPGDGQRILLVEDHEPTLVALTHLLTRRHYTVFGAANAAQARALAAQGKIDFVISDIGLPDDNGNVLMNELRQRHGLKGIALTGYGMERDVEECLASGFITHLVKPVNIQALEGALGKIRTA
jgi:signal transduction histidine kinase